MAQTTSLVFNGGVIPSPSPAPSGNGKAKLLKIGEITITEQGVQVTKKVICDPDSVTAVEPFMEVLTSAKLAELVEANSIIVLDDGDMQYLMANANITVEEGISVCTAVNFLGLSKENKAKVAYNCTRITDELTLQQVIEVGEPVETDFNLVSADSEDTAPETLIDKLEVVDNVRDPEDPTDEPLLSIETAVDGQGNRKVAINEDNLRTFVNNVSDSFDAIGNLQTTVSSQGKAIGNLQNGKKDKQQPKTFNGSATKTVKKVTQNENGEVTVVYEDIGNIGTVGMYDIMETEQSQTVGGGSVNLLYTVGSTLNKGAYLLNISLSVDPDGTVPTDKAVPCVIYVSINRSGGGVSTVSMFTNALTRVESSGGYELGMSVMLPVGVTNALSFGFNFEFEIGKLPKGTVVKFNANGVIIGNIKQ